MEGLFVIIINCMCSLYIFPFTFVFFFVCLIYCIDILNDETTRKYLQSVKRLITFCQYKYPVDPSHSVEWNAFNNW